MRIVSLALDNRDEVIEEAVDVLKRGGSVVYPTDTVYGLGANPFDDFVVRRLFKIKKRSASKPVPLMVKNVAMAKKLAYIDSRKEKILRSVWPGAVTVVLYRRSIISTLISAGTDTVALRMPDNKFCIDLIRTFNGPITSTSANISGENPTNNSEEVRGKFKKEAYGPDFMIDAGLLEAREPSTILDLTRKSPRVTRIGPVKPRELARILKL